VENLRRFIVFAGDFSHLFGDFAEGIIKALIEAAARLRLVGGAALY
jgi:hypothetical protein